MGDYAQHTSCVQEDDKYHGQWAKSKKGNNAKLKGAEIKSNGHAASKTVPTAVPNVSSKDTANGTSDDTKKKNTRKRPEFGLPAAEIDKKRKRDCDDEKAPPTKKAKLDSPTTNGEGEQTSMSAKKQAKRLKKLLKDESGSISLHTACTKFNEAMGIDQEDKRLFLERLWDLKKKIKISY